ncbi:MAG: TatD family hydrolase, partial [Sulfuricella sp.]|nr:TatD family hydrolase [Sulfuricella sp.]
MLIDTHCHLDAAEFDADRDEVAARASAAGVGVMVVPGVERAGFEAVLAACERYPGCVPALGIHPLYVGSAAPEDLTVLREIVRSQEVTRGGLATACDLSTATITNVVGDLIREGLVEERGSVPSEGGRPIAKLGVRATGAYVLGADVGEKGVAVELFDLSMQRLDREFREGATREANPREVIEALRGAVRVIRARNPRAEARL